MGFLLGLEKFHDLFFFLLLIAIEALWCYKSRVFLNEACRENVEPYRASWGRAGSFALVLVVANIVMLVVYRTNVIPDAAQLAGLAFLIGAPFAITKNPASDIFNKR